MRPLIAALLLSLILAACGSNDPGGRLDPVTPASSDPTSATSPSSATDSPSAPGTLTLVAAGDVMFARSVGDQVRASGPGVVFDGVRPVLASADLALVNLETAIGQSGAAAAKGYTFQASPATVAALVDGGIDIVSQANNHALDYGPDALLETRELLEAAGIASAGSGANHGEVHRPALAGGENGQPRIAVLGYVDSAAEGSYNRANWEATAEAPGVAWADTVLIAEDVAAARAEADIVVVMLHAGIEYDPAPSALQRSYAEAAIDAGAALVIGHHPHVLQPVEQYGDGLIVYSLGNFVFDGFDGSANETAILRAELSFAGVESWELIPARVVNGLPVLVE